MEDIIFDIFSKSKIYFCKKQGDPKSTNVRMMMRCFDIFIVEEGWLFYRLKDHCKEIGYIDEDECLIGPCDGYDKMICLAKMYDGDIPVNYIESLSWVEESDFYQHRKNGTIGTLINEISKIERGYSYDTSTHEDDSNCAHKEYNSIVISSTSDDDDTEEDTCEELEIVPENEIAMLDDIGNDNKEIDNFKHGYTSTSESE